MMTKAQVRKRINGWIISGKNFPQDSKLQSRINTAVSELEKVLNGGCPKCKGVNVFQQTPAIYQCMDCCHNWKVRNRG